MRSTWLGIGERINSIGALTWAWRIRSMFSMRESPSATTPAATSAAGEFGRSPSSALVTPVTEMPTTPRPDRRGGARCGDPVEVDVESEPAHRAGDRCSPQVGERREHHVDEPVGRSGEGIGRRDPELDLVHGDRRGHLGVGHVLVVDRQSDHLRVGEGLDEVDLARRRRHREGREVADHGACRGVLEDDGGGSAAAQDRRRAEVGRVAERTLAFDDDHVGVLGLERRRRRPPRARRPRTAPGSRRARRRSGRPG